MGANTEQINTPQPNPGFILQPPEPRPGFVLIKDYDDTPEKKEVERILNDNTVPQEANEPGIWDKFLRVFESDFEDREFQEDLKKYEEAKKTFKKEHPEMYGPTYKEALDFGWQSSVWGLSQRGKIPEGLTDRQLENLSTTKRLLSTAATVAGDMPYMVLGAIPGAVMGGPVAPLTAMGGAFALPQGLRQVLMDRYEKGEVDSFGEFWRRLMNASEATIKGYATGVATKSAGMAYGLPAEIGAMVTVGAALDGRVPEAKEFLDAAVLIGGLRTSTWVAGKLRRVYAQTGKTPQQVLMDIEEDPIIRKEMLQDKATMPEEYQRLRARQQLQKDIEEIEKKPFELKPTELTPEEEIAIRKRKGEIVSPDRKAQKVVIPEEKVKAPTAGKQVTLLPPKRGEAQDLFPVKAKLESAETFRSYVRLMGGISSKDSAYRGEIRDIKKGAGWQPGVVMKKGMEMDELLAKIKEQGDWKGIIETEQDVLTALERNTVRPEFKGDIYGREFDTLIEEKYGRLDKRTTEFKEAKARVEREVAEELAGEEGGIAEKDIKAGQLVDEDGFDWRTGKQISLEEVGAKFGKEVDQIVEKKAQEGAIRLPVREKAPKTADFKFEDPDIESRVQGAKGARSEPLWNRLTDKIQSIGHKISRVYEHLPKTREFAQLDFDLRRLAKQKGAQGYKTLEYVRGVLLNLKKPEYNLFWRKVLAEDLLETAKEGKDIPFGFTKEGLQIELTRLDSEISKNPVILDALERRKALWTGLEEDYAEAMGAIGVDVSDAITRKNYFRHQILDYVDAKQSIVGVGKKFKVVRESLKKRKGSVRDINVDYIQAEHEIIAQKLYEMEVARTLEAIDKNHNIADQVRGKAKLDNYVRTVGGEENYQRLQDLRAQKAELQEKGGSKDMIARITEEIWELDPTMGFRVNIARGFGGLRKGLGYEDVTMADVAKLAKLNDPDAQMILKAISDRDTFMKDLLGKDYENWKNFIDERTVPEGYTIWQPEQGNIFYLADTIPAKLAEKLATGALQEIGLTADQIGKALAVGGKRRQYVIKEEVAKTLNNLAADKSQNVLNEWHVKTLRAWKQWSLVSPRRYVKYNARNLTGDADAVFAGRPSVFKEVPAAFGDLWNVYARKGTMSPDLKAWFERGGMEANLQAQEMGELNHLKIFQHIEQQRTQLTKIPLKVWYGYWKTARLSTDFREGILRYAAFKRFKGEMQKNKDGMPNDFAASVPEEIRGLADINDRSYQMANDLLGAYDRVGILGQNLRSHWWPFWSFKEVNFRRYQRMFRNAAANDRTAYQAGKAILGKVAIKMPFRAMQVGKWMIRATTFWAAAQAWNHLKFPDEEADLPPEVKNRPHIIFGRTDDGEIMAFTRIGAMGDLLEWVGLDAAPQYVDALFQGKMTVKEIAMDMAKQPLNLIIQGGNPFIKVGAELLSRQSFFPDIYKPRAIRDWGLHVMRGLGLQNEYIALTDKPSKGYWDSIKDFFVYTYDPLQSSYGEILSLRKKFLEKKGKGGQGFWMSPRGNALYNARLAIRYGDEESAMASMAKYAHFLESEPGWTELSKPEMDAFLMVKLKKSIENLQPLAALSNDEKLQFVKSLSTEEKKTLIKAQLYYMELATGQDITEILYGETE